MKVSQLEQVIGLHADLLKKNPYCYFELAYTRQTMWMVWICSKPHAEDPQRKVIAQGQGATPEAAAKAAIKSFPRKS